MDLVQRMRYNKKGKIWYETWSKELDYRGKTAYFDFAYAVCVDKKYAVRGAVYIRYSKVDLVNLPIYDGMYATLIGKELNGVTMIALKRQEQVEKKRLNLD